MGMIPPEQVSDVFYVKNGGGADSSSASEAGVTFLGSRVDLTIEDIVAAEGKRQPTSANAPKNFNMAFAILVRDGEQLKPNSAAEVDRLRTEWETTFSEITLGEGSVDTTLRER